MIGQQSSSKIGFGDVTTTGSIEGNADLSDPLLYVTCPITKTNDETALEFHSESVTKIRHRNEELTSFYSPMTQIFLPRPRKTHGHFIRSHVTKNMWPDQGPLFVSLKWNVLAWKWRNRLDWSRGRYG